MKRNGELHSRAVKEVIRMIDAREKEEEHANNEHGYRK